MLSPERIPSSPDSAPSLWVRRFAIVERLHPFTLMEGRDIPLYRGLNIVWGNGQDANVEDLLAGHSVGKTLFCRLVRYGLGEKDYAPDDFQQRIEIALPEAYVGLEVVIKGAVWSVLRPLCRRKSIGRGLARDSRSDYASPIDSLESLADRRRTDSRFDDYVSALEGLADECLPAGLEYHERPFDWASLMQWFARDQEARYVDVMVLRSQRSKTTPPLDQEKSDMLVRSALGLADAEEARLSHRVREKHEELHKTKKENDRNRAIMWAVTQQLMLRHVGLDATTPSHADSGQNALTADVVLQERIDEQEPIAEAAKKAYQDAQRKYDAAYDRWRPVQERVESFEAFLAARADTDASFAQDLKDLKALKEWLKDHGHLICERCEKVYSVACEDRLAEEEELRSDSAQRQDAARVKRETKREAVLATLEDERPRRDQLWEEMNTAIAARDAAQGAYCH